MATVSLSRSWWRLPQEAFALGVAGTVMAAGPAAGAAASAKRGFLCGFCHRRLPKELATAVRLLGFRKGGVPVLAADSVRRPRVVVQAGLAVQFLESFGGPPRPGRGAAAAKKGRCWAGQ